MYKNNLFKIFYFFLKREIYYHKIQYSKVFKHDIVAALFGVVIGAFVAYLSLNTLGSGSPDLSDMTILFWYIYLVFLILKLNLKLKKYEFNFFFYFFYFLNIIIYNILL